MCPICAKPDCKGRHDGNDGQNESDTTKSDVYAFGILYYAVRLDRSNLFTAALTHDAHRYISIMFHFKAKTAFNL